MAQDNNTGSACEPQHIPVRDTATADAKRTLDLLYVPGSLICAASLKPYPRQEFFTDTTEAARWAIQRDQAGDEVYFAPAMFSERRRRKETARGSKALHLDIDVGPNKRYGTRHAARTGLDGLCAAARLHAPLIVSSGGGGLHAYWIFEDLIPRDRWLQAAHLLKAACERFGLAADHSRTTDIASLMRLPGCHHRKRTPVRVEVLQWA